MDNLESVRDDRIKAFLRNVPSPTKAIITSRESLDVADVRPLTGLGWKEAEELIVDECEVREVVLTPQQRERIFELTSGLPLPIKLGIARMAGGETFALVDRWLGDAVGELPEYCVKGQIDLVRERDPNAWKMLLACALFDREAGASREALGAIADLSLADRDIALAQLQRFFLVNRTNTDRFWVLPIVQRFVSTAFSDTATARPLLERWVKWLADFARVVGFTAASNAETMRLLEIEYPNLRMGIQWCAEREHHTLVVMLCEGTWYYAYRAALFSDLESMVRIWLHATIATHDKCAEGRVLLHLARLCWNWERESEALACLDRADAILEECGDYDELADAWAISSQICRLWHRFEEATEFAQKILDLGKRLNDSNIMALAFGQFARIEKTRQNFTQALLWLDQAEVWAKQNPTHRTRSHMLYARATTLISMGRHSEAEPLLLEVLTVDLELGERRYIALCKYRLAEVYAATGRLSAAKQLVEEIRSLTEFLDMKRLQAMVEKLAAELP
jgi:tetratricopeptide (TPR) repeat protein